MPSFRCSEGREDEFRTGAENGSIITPGPNEVIPLMQTAEKRSASGGLLTQRREGPAKKNRKGKRQKAIQRRDAAAGRGESEYVRIALPGTGTAGALGGGSLDMFRQLRRDAGQNKLFDSRSGIAYTDFDLIPIWRDTSGAWKSATTIRRKCRP